MQTLVGTKQTLSILGFGKGGARLDGGESGPISLPNKYLTPQLAVGDSLEVFVYADKSGRLRATVQQPVVTVGHFARLRVVATASHGAYLDWGLPKDLLAPRSEQKEPMKEGESYVVYVFCDERSGRIAASSKLDKFVDKEPCRLGAGDAVSVFICEKTALGYKVIVDERCWGVVYSNQIFTTVRIGQRLQGYVHKVREDNKLDIVLQETGMRQVSHASQTLYETLQKHGGHLSLTDKTPPDIIYAQLGMSKKVFKKALGALYKRGLISLNPDGVRIKDSK